MKSLLNDFRFNLCEMINNTDLPLDIKYYIVKDVFREVSDLFNQYLSEPDNNKRENISSDIQTEELENGDLKVTVKGDLERGVEKAFSEISKHKKNK